MELKIGPELIWPNIAIHVNAIFQKIFALRRVKQIVHSKEEGINKNVTIGMMQMQMICDVPVFFGKTEFHAKCIDRPNITK